MNGVARLRGSLDDVTFIALSEFARDLLVRGGLSPDRIHIKPNFVEPDPGGRSADNGTFVFAGRLSQEKGIDRLLEAWSRLPSEIQLEVIGDGPFARRSRLRPQARPTSGIGALRTAPRSWMR